VFQDYQDKVHFFYVYKTLAHSGINGFVEPITIDERLKHVAIAKDRMNTEIPWLCDSMDNKIMDFFAGPPNGEFIIDPEGKIVRQRFWSSADELRADLEELVGKSKSVTDPEKMDARFRVETFSKEDIASGVMPEIDLPKGLAGLKTQPQPSDQPFYAKLRVEATQAINVGGGKLHFMLSLDPIYEMHWNNLAGNVQIEISDADGLKLSSELLEAEKIEAKADVDPRRCLNVKQEYRIVLAFDRAAGTRPGVFMTKMFQDVSVSGMDKNEDGVISLDELPKRSAQLMMNHLDYSANGVIEPEEIEKFRKMFNNGTTLGRPDGTKSESKDDEDSSPGESHESK